MQVFAPVQLKPPPIDVRLRRPSHWRFFGLWELTLCPNRLLGKSGGQKGKAEKAPKTMHDAQNMADGTKTWSQTGGSINRSYRTDTEPID